MAELHIVCASLLDPWIEEVPYPQTTTDNTAFSHIFHETVIGLTRLQSLHDSPFPDVEQGLH